MASFQSFDEPLSWEGVEPIRAPQPTGLSFEQPEATPVQAPQLPGLMSSMPADQPYDGGGEWGSSWQQPSSPAGTTTAAPGGYQAPAAPAASPTPSTPDFSAAVAALQGLTDPTEIAVQRDKLARDLYAQLSSSGHDVKWQGEQLIVDGRPYEIGGASAAATGIAPGEQTPGNTPVATGGTVGQYGIPEGAVPSKFNDTGYNSAKYDFSRIISKYPPTPEGLRMAEAELDAAGYGNVDILGGSGDKVRTAYGDEIDFIKDVDGNPSWWYGSEQEYRDANPGAGAGAAPPVTIDSGGRYDTAPQDATDAAAAPPGFVPGRNGGWVPPDHPDAAPGAVPAGAAAPWAPGQGAQYTPGEIGFDDIPDFNYQQLLDDILGGDEVDDETRNLLMSILQNPESLDARTVETMKAQSKEELADMQALDEQDLAMLGEQSGIGDSSWLRSERNATRRSRDNALIDSNRAIDLEAAATRTGDRRAAAQLGMTYQGQKAAQRQGAVSLATNATLQRASLIGDRMALRESIQQEAARLGQSADQVMSSWLLGNLDNATRRYGIDVAAGIDMRRLNQQSQEWKEELAFKIAQLEQQDRQFGAGYGLDLTRLQSDMDNEAFDRSSSEFE